MLENSKQRMPVKRQLKLGTILGLAAGILYIVTHPIVKTQIDVKSKYQLGVVEKNVVSALINDEVANLLQEDPAVFKLQDLGVAETISAHGLASAYESNEVAADNRFREKYLLVRGTVQAISKDFMDNPTLQLVGKNMFMNVHAGMDEKELPNLAEIQKGETISLVCIGNGVTLGSPMLKDCRYAFAFLKQASIQKINNFLNADLPDDKKIATMISFGLYAATQLPVGSACQVNDLKDCAIELEKSFSQMEKPTSKNQKYVSILQDFKNQGLLSQESYDLMMEKMAPK